MRRILLLAVLAPFLAAAPARAQYTTDPDQMVATWYQRYLGRQLDSLGASVWGNALRQGQAPAAVLDQILGSPEYYQRAGNTPQGFVQRLFLDVIGRAPSPAESNYWVSQLSYTDATQVAYNFLTRYPPDFSAPAPPGVGSSPSPPPPPVPSYEYRRPYRPWHRPFHDRDWRR